MSSNLRRRQRLLRLAARRRAARAARKSRDAAGWLHSFAKHPRSIGSVLPSSKFLARAMTEAALKYGAAGALVIEAGAGKGAITGTLAAALPHARLIACEYMADFAAELQHRQPETAVFCCRVQDLPQWAEPGNKTIVSSLPFRSLPQAEAADIARFLQTELRRNPASVLIQFTYGIKNPIPPLADDPAIASFRHATVLRNCPPATVWVYRAKAQGAA